MRIKTVYLALVILSVNFNLFADGNQSVSSFLGKEFVDIQQLDDITEWELYLVVAKDGSITAGGRKRSEDGGSTWADIEKRPCGGSGYVVDESTGYIYKLGDGEKPQALISLSKDNGKTWEREIEVNRPVDSRGWLPTPMAGDQGTTLRYGQKKGRLIIPARVFVGYGGFKGTELFEMHYATALYSDDHGKTWIPSEPFPLRGTGEQSLVELSDGRIYFNTRTHTRAGNRLIAVSYDSGETWTDARMCDYLPDGPPDVYGNKGGLARLPLDDRDILIYSQNDTIKGDLAKHIQNNRENMTIWVSFDGGETWPVKRRLDSRGGYSCLAVGRAATASEGMIYLLGHSGFFARFNLSWILGGIDEAAIRALDDAQYWMSRMSIGTKVGDITPKAASDLERVKKDLQDYLNTELVSELIATKDIDLISQNAITLKRLNEKIKKLENATVELRLSRIMHQGEMVFVERGTPWAAYQAGSKWHQGEDYISNQGTGNSLWSYIGLMEGDFYIRARLSLEQIGGSACAFMFGNYHDQVAHTGFFHFDAGRRIAVERAIFGARGELNRIANTSDFIKEGEPFLFEAIRTGETLTILIDRKRVYQQDVGNEAIGAVGFRPWRAKMKIYDCRASGVIDKPEIVY